MADFPVAKDQMSEDQDMDVTQPASKRWQECSSDLPMIHINIHKLWRVRATTPSSCDRDWASRGETGLQTELWQCHWGQVLTVIGTFTKHWMANFDFHLYSHWWLVSRAMGTFAKQGMAHFERLTASDQWKKLPSVPAGRPVQWWELSLNNEWQILPIDFEQTLKAIVTRRWRACSANSTRDF